MNYSELDGMTIDEVTELMNAINDRRAALIAACESEEFRVRIERLNLAFRDLSVSLGKFSIASCLTTVIVESFRETLEGLKLTQDKSNKPWYRQGERY